MYLELVMQNWKYPLSDDPRIWCTFLATCGIKSFILWWIRYFWLPIIQMFWRSPSSPNYWSVTVFHLPWVSLDNIRLMFWHIYTRFAFLRSQRACICRVQCDLQNDILQDWCSCATRTFISILSPQRSHSTSISQRAFTNFTCACGLQWPK